MGRRAPDRPVEAGGECEARAGGHGIDDKIAEPRVPSRHPKLQDFEQADQGDGNRRRRPAVAAVGQTERQSDQDKGEGVFAVLTEIGMRPICRRTERCEGDSGGQDPGDRSENDIHRAGIARSPDGYGCRSRDLEMPVWLMQDSPVLCRNCPYFALDASFPRTGAHPRIKSEGMLRSKTLPDYSGSRTPMPCMKRSLICTGSRRVVPTPGLSSMRTPISVGPDADID